MDLSDFLNNSILLLKKEEMISIIGPDADQFRKLFELSFSRKMPVCWRATWLMDNLAENFPWLAEKYVGKLWSEVPKNHPIGVTRSCLRLLTRYDIPEADQGIATDICLEWLTKESIPVAIKVYCMEILANIAKVYPELSNEFIVIIEEQLPNNSIAYKARAKHVIRALSKV